MPHGFHGKILRVDLSRQHISVEEQPESFYRRYLGGRALISYYLLRELKPGLDPLGPENKLIFAPGVITGAPASGCGRNSVGAKSPLTNAYGDAEVGGYFGAELKRAGYDAVIVEGKAPRPLYLWIQDGQAELREAGHLWGKTTGETYRILQQESGDLSVRLAAIGPAGEKLVRFACIMNDVSHAAGRTGMGAVMGSKNLKAIAVRARQPLSLADPATVNRLAKWMRDNVPNTAGRSFHDLGTAQIVGYLNRNSGLPTRNFREGVFEGADAISGKTMKETILIGRGSCFACAVRCKRQVRTQAPYQVDPLYGGPEYETLASLGSNCGLSDLVAVAKANELCNAYSLDTISTGMAVSFAMECFEKGILTGKDTGGLELSFGNAAAMVKLVEMIGRREGLGDVLAEGVMRAARKIGRGAEEYALHVKGQEIPMHEPRWKQGLGLGYAVSPTGADHCHNLHDSVFAREGPGMDEAKPFGVLEPVPVNDLGPAKVRLFMYTTFWRYLENCLVFCQFVPFDQHQLLELVRGVTGWNTTFWELLKVGERAVNMTRAFNLREGLGKDEDRLPQRFFAPFTSGPLQGVAINPQKLEEAKLTYYQMMGWDASRGVPSLPKLQELGIEWVGEALASPPPK